jgi:hypothetical protein
VVLIGQDRVVGVRVVLVENPRHVTHVHDVGGVPRTERVADAAPCVGVDVDAVEIEGRAAAGRLAMDNAGEPLVLGSEAGGRVARGIAVTDRVEGIVGVGDESGDPLSRGPVCNRHLGVAPYHRPRQGRAVTDDRASRSDLEQKRPQREHNNHPPPSARH